MKIKNKIFILVGFSEFFSKALAWLTLAVIPLFANPKNYGEIVLYYSIIVFFTPVFLFGQDRLILKNDAKNELIFSIFFSVLVFLICFPLLNFFGYALVALAGLFLSLNKVYLTYLRSNEEYLKYGFNRVLYSILRLVIVLAVVYFFYSLENYILAELFVALILTIGILFQVKIDFKGFDFLNRFKHGLPLMLHGISLFGIALCDRFILEKMVGIESVGVYSYLYLYASGLVFLFSIISIVQEKKIYQSKKSFELLINIKKTLFMMLAIGVVGGVLSFILYLLVNCFELVRDYGYYPFELFILILSHVILPIYLVGNYYLVQSGRSNMLLFCSFFALVINILFNVVLINFYGMVGAVWATLFANISLVFFVIFVCMKISKTQES